MLSLFTISTLQNMIHLTQDMIYLFTGQEVRWLGRSIIKKKECKIYCSFDDNIFLE